MKKAQAVLAFMLAAVTAFTATGCGASSSAAAEPEPTPTATAEPTPEPPAPQPALNVMLESPVETLDPQLAADSASFEIITDLMDGLLQMDADSNVSPALAESYDVSEDGLTYTFHLRSDALWANGDAVTAADFVFAWQRAVDPATKSPYAYLFSDVAQIQNAAEIRSGLLPATELGVTAVNSTTLQVVLNVPVSSLPSLLCLPVFYPVNQAFYTACADTFGTSPDTFLSNGAFALASYEPDAPAFELTKNDSYYDVGRIQLTGLNYYVVQDSEQALANYQAGTLDVAAVAGEQVDAVLNDAAHQPTSTGTLWSLYLNQNSDYVLTSQNMRSALMFAIDRDSLCSDTLKNGSTAARTIVPAQAVFNADGTDFTADSDALADICSYDPDKAAECYEAVKSLFGLDSLTLELLADADDVPQKTAQAIKEQLESTLPGLTIRIISEPKAQRLQDVQAGNFQLALVDVRADYTDAAAYLTAWTDANNTNGWYNADYDALLASCTAGELCTDAEGRWNALHDAQRMLLEDAAVLPLYQLTRAQLVRPGYVTGVAFAHVGISCPYKDAVIQG